MLYVRHVHLTKAKHIQKGQTHPILLSEMMLHKDYNRKGSVEKKKLWSWASKAWSQDELIGGKPSVVK
jgi:hypothetical protein